ncbi:MULTISPECIES: hypothetical protein [Microvirgula]|nr:MULTISPECIES: hypothetical protein [Microvirgula]RAS19172.1 hypothetical protein DFO50_102336 [Microvirgula sp. AG722]
MSMSAAEIRARRDIRKQLYRLELESHRLELVSVLDEMKHPIRQAGRFAAMLGLLRGGSSGWIAALGSLAASSRWKGAARFIPLALAGWRLAGIVRRLIARRR